MRRVARPRAVILLVATFASAAARNGLPTHLHLFALAVSLGISIAHGGSSSRGRSDVGGNGR